MSCHVVLVYVYVMLPSVVCFSSWWWRNRRAERELGRAGRVDRRI